MRVNTGSASGGGVSLGGTAAGVYPGIVEANVRVASDFEKFDVGTSCQSWLVPVNFSTTPQNAINTMVTEVKTKFGRGERVFNSGESEYSKFGNWVGAQRLKYLKVSPLGKSVAQTLAGSAAMYTSALYRICMIDTSKLLVVWLVPDVPASPTKHQFYAQVATIGANGYTWGTASALGVYQSTTTGIAYWSVCKQATDKFMIYFNNQADSNYLSAVCTTVSGTTVGTPGTIQRITAAANKSCFGCYAASDKSMVSTNVATDLAYVLTTSGTTITLGTGVRITTTACHANQPPALAYLADNTILEVHEPGAGAAIYGAVNTISGTVITHNTEATLSVTSSTDPQIAVLNSTTFVVTPSSSSQSFSQGTISGTTITFAAKAVAEFPHIGSATVIPIADTANSECWLLSGAKVYKCAISGGNVVNENYGSHAYEFSSSDSTQTVSGLGIGKYCSGPSGSAIIGEDISTTIIGCNMLSESKLTVTINGSVEHTAAANSIGLVVSLNTDLSADGYAEIQVYNNTGNVAGFMIDEIDVTAI